MDATMAMLVQVLIPLGMMAMVVLIVWFRHDSKRKAKERQAEIVLRLIDRFSTGEAFAAAIQGPAGSKLAEVLALEDLDRKWATWKGLFVAASVQTFLGIGFLVLSYGWDDDLLLPAVVIGSIGLALALSTYVMWRVEQRNGDGSGDDKDAEFKTMDAAADAGTDGL